MNTKHIRTALVITAAGLLGATGAMAQQAVPSTAATPPSQSPSGMMQSDQSKTSMPSRSEPATAAFSKLDAGKRGYVTREELSQLQGFDFQTADKNNDGKLDSTEFNSAWTAYSKSK